MMSKLSRCPQAAMGILMLAAASAGLSAAQAPGGKPVQVEVVDEKPVFVESALPIDPTPRVRYAANGANVQIMTEQNQQLHLSHYDTLNIDGRVMQAGQGGRFEKTNAPLAKSAGGKARQGLLSVYVVDDLRITVAAELAATRAADRATKREMGTVLVRYTVENIGKQPRKFGLKSYFDIYVVTNDGALFAAPTMPNKILDGVEFKDKTLPEYVQCLERPDLKNPGYVAHLTIDLGSSIEKASRVVLSRHGAGGFNGWEMPAMQSMGDSAIGVYFDIKEIKPGGKREFGYAYGKGIAAPLANEGRVEMRLGGSFEPGKMFTVTALVHDPVAGQALLLDLPKGMALLQGRELQPVPQPLHEPPQSLVIWKCRVLDLGKFPLRLHSSTGATQTKLITIRATP